MAVAVAALQAEKAKAFSEEQKVYGSLRRVFLLVTKVHQGTS